MVFFIIFMCYTEVLAHFHVVSLTGFSTQPQSPFGAPAAAPSPFGASAPAFGQQQVCVCINLRFHLHQVPQVEDCLNVLIVSYTGPSFRRRWWHVWSLTGLYHLGTYIIEHLLMYGIVWC